METIGSDIMELKFECPIWSQPCYMLPWICTFIVWLLIFAAILVADFSLLARFFLGESVVPFPIDSFSLKRSSTLLLPCSSRSLWGRICITAGSFVRSRAMFGVGEVSSSLLLLHLFVSPWRSVDEDLGRLSITLFSFLLLVCRDSSADPLVVSCSSLWTRGRLGSRYWGFQTKKSVARLCLFWLTVGGISMNIGKTMP